ncbi:PQQ-dependent sugar dehydrogenase [Sphingomonas alba]|uniref:PQQ-dependent sugar dehydrogenase n=1 Tax=Sphingomonas alba TaxID=2908208 RepID=A0ABT0RP91_9SPHN|nr:PQQ-dependent sugar dehydrogenase [Sphingomonas alba]MCL6684400.1 PQQ-dependent sugar dehydrogenase [Sphingomonas alba]
MTLRFMQAAMLLLTACGASPSDGQSGDRPFTVAPVATFDAPWAMAFLPGSGVPMTNVALVTEKPGHIWLIDVGTGRKQEVAGAPKVLVSSQGGLLDIVPSPGFAGDQTVYLSYSEPSPSGGSSLALARAKLADLGSAPRLDGLTVLWRDPGGGKGGQFGARIAFAPDGRSLFLTVGERQRFTPAQDASQPLGKILHLTLDGKPMPDNPMAGRAGAAKVTITDPPRDTQAARSAAGHSVAWPGMNSTPVETWSSGHRNPYGLAFAPDGRLWEHEMGPRGGDEVNLILPGKNYGWPVVSNGDNYDGVPIPDHRGGDGFEAPKVFWNPSVSPSSMIIYTGNLFPQWKGDALIGALSGQAFIRVDIDGDKARKANQWDMGARIREVEQGPRGEVYLLEDGEGGRLLRLEPVRR